MNNHTPVPFDNRYAQLPDRFFAREAPTPVSAPELIRVNGPLARNLGIDPAWLASPAGVAMMAGNELPPGATPIATVYGGHQFGAWNPQLGDGRAILLGEVVDESGRRFDIQLKGAGQTPYSRMGDGRSPLGPVLREYIVSEAMAALGIPTTRSLGAVTTGERVFRDRALPGAILSRVARSHIRVGHFQYFLAGEDWDAIQTLADHVIARDFPHLQRADAPYLSLLQETLARQADLIAQWMSVGFIHGVMNTDNMLICGETIDYGPCAFMDDYNPAACFSSIDRGGRYAYKNQPAIAHWNLSWFAQSLLPLLDSDQERALAMAQEALDEFPVLYEAAYNRKLHDKFGFAEPSEDTLRFIEAFLGHLAAQSGDFTLAFRRLAELADDPEQQDKSVPFDFPSSFDTLLENWRQLRRDNSTGPLKAINPALIPRNHLVEEAIVAAESDGDLGPFHALVDRLATPFDYRETDRRLALPPEPHQVVHQTFCGT